MSVANTSVATVNRSSRCSARRRRPCSGQDAAGLTFQHTNARERSGASQMGRQVHVGDRLGHVRIGACAAEVVLVDPPAGEPVEIQEARSGPPEVAADRRQHRDAAHDVAAGLLALEPLADPQQRRPGPVQVRRGLDVGRRHPGPRLRPLRVARGGQLEQLLPADGAAREEILGHESVSARARAIRPNASAASLPGKGWRCRSARSAVGVRTGSTTTTAPGASTSQCSCW